MAATAAVDIYRWKGLRISKCPLRVPTACRLRCVHVWGRKEWAANLAAFPGTRNLVLKYQRDVPDQNRPVGVAEQCQRFPKFENWCQIKKAATARLWRYRELEMRYQWV